MKIKKSFVTNSSSASFILTIKTASPMTMDQFKNKFNECIEDLKNRFRIGIDFYEGGHIDKLSDVIFQISDHTSMYNDISDIPSYMYPFIISSHLSIDNVAEEFHKYDFRKADFIIENDY